ncbi:MAG: MarR family winged helix-turn-helix transcriptional regulator [Acidimicrobiales bacterium]
MSEEWEDAQATRLQVAVSRLMRAFRRHGAAGLTPSQISALASIKVHGPLRLSQLATLESVGAPAATRVVASLEDLGLVQRHDDVADRRASLVGLTARGQKTLVELRHERTVGLSAKLAQLTARERTLIEAALPVLERLAHDEPEE